MTAYIWLHSWAFYAFLESTCLCSCQFLTVGLPTTPCCSLKLERKMNPAVFFLRVFLAAPSSLKEARFPYILRTLLPGLGEKGFGEVFSQGSCRRTWGELGHPHSQAKAEPHAHVCSSPCTCRELWWSSLRNLLAPSAAPPVCEGADPTWGHSRPLSITKDLFFPPNCPKTE